MKLRKGFVSNSSSASFIVTLTISEKKFQELLIEAFGYEYFSVDSFLKILESDLKEVEKQILKYNKTIKKSNIPDILKNFKRWDLEKANSLTKQIAQVKKLNEETFEGKKELIEKILSYYEIFLTKEGEKLKLLSGTDMFNSYEDVPDFLKILITMFNFKNIKLNCETIQD